MEQRLIAGEWGRHRHHSAYAAIVLSGGYQEFGDAGRWCLQAGDIVAHCAFEAHGNLINMRGAVVCNFPLPDNLTLPSVFEVAQPDELVRTVRLGHPVSISALRPIIVKPPKMTDWPDELAAAIRLRTVKLNDWASMRGLAPATVSRGFKSAFGTTAARYRLESQVRRALHDIRQKTDTLAAIAHDRGFADQAHMCRAVLALTGHSPIALRKVNSVQDLPAGER